MWVFCKIKKKEFRNPKQLNNRDYERKFKFGRNIERLP